ncbi:hypothetical protein M427DRAFT_56698 [Gonapodya prolifera JEL478]|uniref:HCP-like protein n=1 Tax=Gonapodya prolifera (strain JEL478) TaxID=1344416 RepID=A0A139AFU6_GONPJ|nr:hypothetical protein M427DRAFT_56698 [Gonapodya prolifera JEL478]|eukprot:KXS15630.1 hypothetical protein M427DRAFT_56698 [Gonapodya prolifera JEL478]
MSGHTRTPSSDVPLAYPAPLPAPPGPLPVPSEKEHRGDLDDPLQLGIWHHENLRLPASAYFFSVSASQGNPLGLLLYGLSLRHGWGVKQDAELGFRCFQLAAKSAVWEFSEGLENQGKKPTVGFAVPAGEGGGEGDYNGPKPPRITRKDTKDVALDVAIHEDFDVVLPPSGSPPKVAVPDFSGLKKDEDKDGSTGDKVLGLLGLHKRSNSSTGSAHKRSPSGSMQEMAQVPQSPVGVSTPPPKLPSVETIERHGGPAGTSAVDIPVFVPTPRRSSRRAPPDANAAANTQVVSEELTDTLTTVQSTNASAATSASSLGEDEYVPEAKPPPKPAAPVTIDATSGPVMTLSRKARPPVDTKEHVDAPVASEAKEGHADSNEPVSALKSIASEQLVLAIFEMGQSFAYGWGTAPNPKLALHYYTLAARLGDSSAMETLGDIYMRGDLGLKKDKFTAAQWYRKALKAGGMKNVPNMEWVWKDKYEPGREGEKKKFSFWKW